MSDAVLAIAAELSVEPILQKLVHAARELGGRPLRRDRRSRRRGRVRAVHHLRDERQADRRDGAAAADARPARRDARVAGAVPHDRPPRRPALQGLVAAAHPDMRSFLGVPIVSRSGIVGAFYLTRSAARASSTTEDQQLIEMLAAHAAVAIENARLYERARELSIVEERNRLARDLHDSVAQKLFGVVLTAEAASTLLARDAATARAQLDRLQELVAEALEELRSLVFELRPPDARDRGARDDVAQARRRAAPRAPAGDRRCASPARRAARRAPTGRSSGSRRRRSRTRSGTRGPSTSTSRSRRATVRSCSSVADDGDGFDPADPGAALAAARAHEHGGARARAGGRLEIDSGRARARPCGSRSAR